MASKCVRSKRLRDARRGHGCLRPVALEQRVDAAMSASGILWTKATRKLYGYGRGRAHPSIEFVACPVCHVPAGVLCTGSNGEPHLDRHYKRCDRYRDWGLSPKRRGPRCGMRGCRSRATHVVLSHAGQVVEPQLLCCYGCGLTTLQGAGSLRVFSATGRS